MSTVSRPSLGTSRVAGKSLGRVWDQQDSLEFSRTSMGISRMAVESRERALGPAE